MSKSRTVNTILNTSTSIFVKILSLILSFILRTVFIKTLGIQYTGVSSLFTDILIVLSFAELGISSAITYSLYKPLSENNYERIAMIMAFFKKLYAIVAFLVLILGLAIIPFLNLIVKEVPDIKENITFIFILFIINTASSYLFIYKSVLLSASQRSYQITIIQIVFSFIRLIFECVILIIFKNYIFYLIFDIITNLVQNIIISHKSSKAFPELINYKNYDLPSQDKKQITKDIKALFLYKISNVVLAGIDSIVISSFLGINFVGILSNYKLITSNINNIINQFHYSVAPSIGNLANETNEQKQYNIFKIISFIQFWITSFCTISLFVLLNPFITLWLGINYIFTLPTVLVLVMDFYLFNMLQPVSSFRTSNGLFIQGKYRPVVMAVLNIILSITFSLKWGVCGVLLGTLVSRIATQAWYDPLLVYRMVFKKSIKLFWKMFSIYSLFTGSCCAIICLISSCIPIDNKVHYFLFLIVLCILIPNIFIILIFRKSSEFINFKQIVMTLLKRRRK